MPFVAGHAFRGGGLFAAEVGPSKMKATILAFLAITISLGAAEPQFEFTMASDRKTYHVGEAPQFTFRITNKSARDVVLLPWLDGSDGGRRSPTCRYDVLDAGGKPVDLRIFVCGNMNQLKSDDFVPVRAGESFDPLGGFFPFARFVGRAITSPGVYTFRFCYSTSDHLEDYLGDERQSHQPISPEIQRPFARVPKLDLQSNELKLTFIPNQK